MPLDVQCFYCHGDIRFKNLKCSSLESSLIGTMKTTYNCALLEGWDSLYIMALLFDMRNVHGKQGGFQSACLFPNPYCKLKFFRPAWGSRQKTGSQDTDYITIIQLREFCPMTLQGNVAV